jgi:SAM-dependent methyltransferase
VNADLRRKQSLFEDVSVPAGLAEDSGRALKPCILCGGTAVRRLYMQAHFPVVRCLACGLVYADEHFQAEDLQRFYSGDYYQRAYVCHPPQIDRKIARDYLRAFRRGTRGRQPGTLVDFGCARGTFLLRLRDGGAPGWTLRGVDINPDEVAMGLREGLDLLCAEPSTAGIEPGSVDVVTAFSVLEHLQDPGSVLGQVARWLRPGGRFIAIVPSGSCLILACAVAASRLFGDRVRSFTDNVFHEEHLYYFTPRTFAPLLHRAGLRLDQVFFQPSYLETHPPGVLVGLAALGLRAASFLLRRQTMLGIVATRA